MNKPNRKLDAHLFVCTNVKRNGESCGAKGGGALRDQLKVLAKHKGADWEGEFRVNAAGCLGLCEEGIAAVLYPEGRWYVQLTPESAPELLRDLEAAVKSKKP